MIRSILIFFLFMVALGAHSQGKTYYSKGSLAADNVSNWNSARDGSGAFTPSNFTSGDFFVIQNGHSMTTSNASSWSIQGDNCGFTIESGGSIQINGGMSINDINNANETVTLQANSLFIDNSGSSNTIRNILIRAANKSVSASSTFRITKDITITNSGLSISFGNLDLEANLICSGAINNILVGGILTIGGNFSFDIGTNLLAGSFTTSGSGSFKTQNTSSNPFPSNVSWNYPVEFYSNAAQTIPAGTYVNLINSGSGTHTTSGSITISGSLKINAGTLNINSGVTLQSSSISSTAQVDQVLGTITYGAQGSVTAERYIPNGNRSYRDLGSIVYNSSKTIYDTWQEQGANNAGLGTTITGKAGVSAGIDPTTGFDKTPTGNPSMYSFINGTWNNVSSTNSIYLNPFQGYRVFIRGDRTIDLFHTPQPITMNAATTLRTTGKLITGTVTYNTSGVSNSNFSSGSFGLNADVNGFSIVANPYASIINWATLSKTNLSGTYWYFDPTIGSNGAYVTWNGITNSNGASAVNQYIQPGQAFFVQGNGSGAPVLTIQETDKASSQTLTAVFGTDPNGSVNKLGVTLWKTFNNKLSPMDGTTAVFNNSYSNAVISTEDATKFYNAGENIAVSENSTLLSIDCRQPVLTTDSINLRLWSTVANTDYTLRIDTRNFSTNTANNGYLFDKYTNTLTSLKSRDTLDYQFKATADSNSYINRFVILFAKPNAPRTPLTMTPTVSVVNKNQINISWTAKGEYDLSSYVIERSTDSINFATLTSLTAKNLGEGTASYNWTDNNPPFSPKYYYRIKAINTVGQQVLISIVLSVDFSAYKPQLMVYPNPIKGTSFNLSAAYLTTSGIYNIEIFNQEGKKVLSKKINIPNAISSVSTITLDNVLPSGVYTIRVSSDDQSEMASFRILKQ